MYTESSDLEQGGLFGGLQHPTRRRAWTDLDRLRRRLERANKKIEESGGTEKDLEKAADLEKKLILREEEARSRWKKSFGG